MYHIIHWVLGTTHETVWHVPASSNADVMASVHILTISNPGKGFRAERCTHR